MSTIDISLVDELLQAQSEDAPCGDDLEYDPQFLSFEIAAAGKPEVQYGDTITPAVPPDWKTVQQLAIELLRRSRDLRVAVPFARALLHMEGLSGLAVGMHLLSQLIAQRWDTVHPQLDPDDDNDPMSRINTLAALGEATVFIRDVKEASMVNSRSIGRFCMRDIDISTGEQAVAEGVEKPAISTIEGAFDDVELEVLQQLHAALEIGLAGIASIETLITEKVGARQAFNLGVLYKLVERACRFVAARLAARGVAPDSEDAQALQLAEGGDGGAATRAPRDDISSRDDVLRMLDKLCGYYSQYEPASPVPILLTRAHRLVNKNFMEVLEDIAPDGMNQAQNILGYQSGASEQ